MIDGGRGGSGGNEVERGREEDEVTVETLDLLAGWALKRGHSFLHYLLRMAIREAESIAFENAGPPVEPPRRTAVKKA